MPDTKSSISRPAQIPAEAGRFDAAVAAGVPPYGARGDKTTGVLVLFDGRVLAPQDSGYDGPALRLPKPRPGMDRTLVTHVEGPCGGSNAREREQERDPLSHGKADADW